MLIWGWRTRMKTLGEGVFYSPAAGQDGAYRLVEARRWFTLFFIPLIPLKVLGTYVECQLTGATYDPSILEKPTNAGLTDQLVAAVREVVATVVLADGNPAGPARRVALQIVGAYADGYDEAALHEDLSRAPQAPLDDRLAYLASALTAPGKEQLLTAAASVAAADGPISDAARESVRRIGEQLGMSVAHVHGIIETADAVAPKHQ